MELIPAGDVDGAVLATLGDDLQNALGVQWCVGDALPLFSMSSGRAARKIVGAMRCGDPELILTVQANLAARFHGMFPGWSTEIASFGTYVLPGPGGIGEKRVTGAESGSAVAPSVLTALNDRAAVRNNEVPSV